MRRGDEEHREQVALIRWADFARARWPELALLHAIPNGGQRHKAVAARMKAEGVRAGVPDLCLPVPRGRWHGLYIEMKTRRGRASPDQRWWLRALGKAGYRAEVCRGWDAARQVIEEYMDSQPVAGAGAAGSFTPQQGELSNG